MNYKIISVAGSAATRNGEQVPVPVSQIGETIYNAKPLGDDWIEGYIRDWEVPIQRRSEAGLQLKARFLKSCVEVHESLADRLWANEIPDRFCGVKGTGV